ncbi:hypothetical protein K443DRAFT_12658 [Laccaria amethystina LaAM-08-1]|uniref:Kinesin light chain n=1 Tax=Laccaria amethystina LaAM-08-1 TaxID=1095629 RepID=A0A0C9X7Y0_9AGAR|nr:hypothetical protein K443DRAFT_12658 [Laccaria amethystina LaAM-08-1]
MANLAATYQNLGKYTEAERMEIQVLDARNRILGVEHPETIKALSQLAETYQNLGKYTEAEKLKIQGLDGRCRILGEEHSHAINTMPNVKDAQDTEVLDVWSTVPEEETFDSVQVVLNPPVRTVLSNAIINPDKKDKFSSKLAKRFSKFKSKIAHLFYKDKDLDDNFAGPSS